MDYFNNVLTTFLGLELLVVAVLSMEGRKLSDLNKKYLNLCSEDERKSYRFGMT